MTPGFLGDHVRPFPQVMLQCRFYVSNLEGLPVCEDWYGGPPSFVVALAEGRLPLSLSGDKMVDDRILFSYYDVALGL